MKTLFVLVCCLFAMPGAKASMVYIPAAFMPEGARVVVAIHGCMQDAETMAHGSGWNLVAEKNNLVIVYPQVPPGTHFLDCWPWWQPENQAPESGLLRQIHDDIVFWMAKLDIPKAPIFLTGISSGAAMVTALAACFPDDYSAIASHSGLSYGLAGNALQAPLVQKMGPEAAINPNHRCLPRNFTGPVMVIHGTDDGVVNPKHARRIISDFLGVTNTKAQFLSENQSSYTLVDHYRNDRWVGRQVTVDKLPHAWSGFNLNLRHPKLEGPKGMVKTSVPFFSPMGPSATNLMFDFFEQALRMAK